MDCGGYAAACGDPVERRPLRPPVPREKSGARERAPLHYERRQRSCRSPKV